MKTQVFYCNTTQNAVFVASPGIYRIECWGAQGATVFSSEKSFEGGKGGYVSGLIKIHRLLTLYVYVGGVGITGSSTPPYNGGGYSQRGGGGASDVRLIGGEWDDFESLKSRIIVAGGGGGTDGYVIDSVRSYDIGGAGGGINGFPSNENKGKGGTQTEGGNGEVCGSFGRGGGNGLIDGGGSGAGGGGYFGGGSSTISNYYGGGGGSSFISGDPNCIAIDEKSTDVKNMIPKSNSVHYSGWFFFETEMIDGNSEMPSPYNTSEFETGHSQYGAVRITFINQICSFHYPQFSGKRCFIMISIFIVLSK